MCTSTISEGPGENMAGQRWVRLDADYFTNPKAQAAGLQGRALHLASICWSATHLTDGVIPVEMVPVLLQMSGVRRDAVDRVVTARLWIPVDNDYLIHDYTDMQPSRASVEESRKAAAERQSKWRRQHRAGDGRWQT